MRMIIAFLFFLALLLPGFSFAQEYSLSKKDTAEVRFLNQRKFFIYKVDKGETLFSISKKFKIPQEEISEFNRELREDGLLPKMKLWIPAWSHLKKEEREDVKKKEIRFEDETYQVALLLALNISKNYSLDLSLADSNVVAESMEKETLANLEFYEGVLRAVDSLRSVHFKVHLFLYDTEGDSSRTSELLKKPELKQADVLISNGNPVITRLLNDFSKVNHISFLSCSLNAADLLHDNKDAVAMQPSSVTQCHAMGEIAEKKFGDYNCIVLKTALQREHERGVAFTKGWLGASGKKMKEVDFAKETVNVIKDSLSKKLNNLIFVPSSNEDLVSKLVSGLKEYSEEYRMTLIGLPTWQYFETIDPVLLELLDVHIFTSSFISFNSPDVNQFRKNFSVTYNTEPAESSFQGFDMMMIAGNVMVKYGKKIGENLTGKFFKGLYSSYEFKKRTENSSIENTYISVCKYRDYELKKVND